MHFVPKLTKNKFGVLKLFRLAPLNLNRVMLLLELTLKPPIIWGHSASPNTENVRSVTKINLDLRAYIA